ncbi:protein kinase [Gemmatimonas sp.]|uniref:protein kinase domain-containing protein n=1 Tax=Gemmatimonas sp. TaxID=1962908 RepID=UPI00286B5363|nr:protein kinase [Gemmatimonas sp.]
MSNVRDELQAALGPGYTLERELGGGGMSRVFVAQEHALGRDVVVKVLSPERAAALSAERFTREIKLAAALQDPHIVPVLVAGTTSDGLPYYTMPFVRGDSLRARMVAGAVPMPEALGILRNIAQALAYAHERGIVHRDIKPENVLLSRGTAVVTDFGIAKALSASSTKAEGNTLTSLGTSIGTPAYMAPEQALGDVNTDARADLYAWGVVAYELLAGAHPFAARSTPQAMVAAHISEAPPSFDAARLGVPRDVAALVMQCLEKNPAQRPPSADALLARLASVTSGSVEQAAAPSRRRAPLVAAGVVVAALAIGGWALLRPRATASSASRSGTETGPVATDSASPVRTLVVLPFESVGGDTANAYFAEGMADELSNALGKVPGLQLAGRSSAAAFRGKQKSAQEIGAALNVGGVLEGTVRRAGGKVRVSTQLTNARTGLVLWNDSFERDARDVFAVQDDIAQAIVRALEVTLAGGAAPAATAARGTTDLEAYDLYQRGMYFYQRRGPGVSRALDYMQQAVAKDPQFADAQAVLGLIWLQMGLYTNTPLRDALPQALAAGKRAVRLDSNSANAWIALGVAHTYAYQWRDADAALRRALRLNPQSVLAHFYLSRLLLSIGRVEDAVGEIQKATTLDPVNFPSVVISAITLSVAGRQVEAIAAAERAWELDSTSTVAQSLSVLAMLRGGRKADALRLAEATLRLARDTVDATAAAYVIGATGDTARVSAMARALASRTKDHPRLNYSLARAWLGARDSVQALSALERAIARQEPIIALIPLSDASYDPIRATPRFAAIVRSLGLDVALFTSPTGGRPR